mgnify:CR=1 FL=1
MRSPVLKIICVDTCRFVIFLKNYNFFVFIFSIKFCNFATRLIVTEFYIKTFFSDEKDKIYFRDRGRYVILR